MDWLCEVQHVRPALEGRSELELVYDTTAQLAHHIGFARRPQQSALRLHDLVNPSKPGFTKRARLFDDRKNAPLC